MSEDVVWRLKAVPLTPIHVGDGEVWDPNDYVIGGDGSARTLHRIATSRVMAAMSSSARSAFLAALDRGNLKDAQEKIERAVTDDHKLESIPVEAKVADELKEARLDPKQYGHVSGFLRSGGRPVLPGSTIKGALRTSYLEGIVASVPERRDEYSNEVKRRHREAYGGQLRTGDLSDELQREAFQIAPGRTEQDPWRDASLSDIAIPNNATRIDRIWNHLRPSRSRPNGVDNDVRIYAERLRSLADNEVVELDLVARFTSASRIAARRTLDGAKAPSRDLNAEWLWKQLRERGFHQWDAEHAAFWAEDTATSDLLRQLVTQAIRDHPGCAILRVGRFGHFESKSVEGVRWNQHHRRKSELRSMGGTRMVVKIGAARVPLGWLLLCPPDFQINPLKRPAAPASAAPGPRHAATPRRATYQGEQVEILARRGGEVHIRFANSDIEWVDELDLDHH